MTYIDDNSRVLIVAAGRCALKDSYRFNAYTCQPNRNFQPCMYIGHYSNKRIDRKISKILGYVNEVQLLDEKLVHTKIIPVFGELKEIEDRFFYLMKRLKSSKEERYLKPFKCMILSLPENSIFLDKDIFHDTKYAFTQGHRYVNFDKLLKAEYTSQLFDIPNK